MNNLTKNDIGKKLAEQFGVTIAHGEDIVDSVIMQITSALALGNGVELRGFATITVRQRGAKVGRNPKTGESVAVPAAKAVHFKPSSKLKLAVNVQG